MVTMEFLINQHDLLLGGPLLNEQALYLGLKTLDARFQNTDLTLHRTPPILERRLLVGNGMGDDRIINPVPNTLWKFNLRLLVTLSGQPRLLHLGGDELVPD